MWVNGLGLNFSSPNQEPTEEVTVPANPNQEPTEEEVTAPANPNQEPPTQEEVTVP